MLNKLIATTFIILCSFNLTLAQKQSKPNIVFILADDLGYGDLSCFGQKKFSTPNIDKLAAKGIKFTQFYAGTSVCAPSRSSLLSGQHTGHTYVRGNKEVQPEGQQPIPDSVSTIAEQFKKAGYATAIFGKWGLGFVGTSGDPNKQGFDTFYGYNCQRESHRFYPSHLWENGKKVLLQGNDELQNHITYAPDLIQAKALDFLNKHRDKPFFLYLTYTLPHAELIVPNDDIFEKFDGKFPEKAFVGQDYGPGATPAGYVSQAKPHATFAAMVTRLDKYVGEVMDKLKALGIDENTLIVFTSDNGPHTEGGADPAFFNSSGGLRGVKRDLYEGGIRVPFIVNWPNKIKKPSVNNHIGAFWDLYPTFSQLLGLKQNSYTDGISILPSILGEKSQKNHAYLYWEFHENNGRQAARKNNWKAVYLDVKTKNEKFELYDLDKDPQEKNDVALIYPEIAKEIKRIMENAHDESVVYPFFKTSK
ncbi:arylsulfatase [Pedobacter frigiditerrae]|uniref:Arylsulfatase n=1 Tax=Pedobacter frigiditerrae TaxID=2530452 RepID=A0A4R0MYG5_9SPHI|nr:arylsulfatase [Pedobacter frigiditerrae]TCC92349.1 arylsulfatase [Pedobacter frigiditerrae]